MLEKSTFLLIASPQDDPDGTLSVLIVLMVAVTMIMLGLLRAAIAPVLDVVKAVLQGLVAFGLAAAVLVMLVVALVMSA
ncbi:hypothetical protein [Pseudosporangium ferrugineum]|uniref:Uncharacterized protein n=1 Tax=Pseudosporangium ferrugineum TaxID=439699 RepID=A0A2T0S4G7_9ACTN|nr:hypothetical protein [Pseudosporangium ferrugineum]PRY28292.1 hypothetical protein CLV70_10884 [Pseudosporangium ferrugineum]